MSCPSSGDPVRWMARRSTARSYCRTSSSKAAVFPCCAWRIRAESSTRIGGPDAGLPEARTGRFRYGVKRILPLSDILISALPNELVTRAVHGEDEARLVRLGLNLLPQAHNVRVHGAGRGKAVVAPHILEQAIAAQGLARMAQKIFQQLEFLGGKIHGLAAARNLATLHIHFDFAKGITLLVFGNNLGAAEHGFHPGQ